MGAEELAFKGLKFLGMLGSGEGGSHGGSVVWTAEQFTYPEDLAFVPSSPPGENWERKVQIALFTKPYGYLYGYDSLTFYVYGTFQPYTDEPWIDGEGDFWQGGPDHPRHPVLANVGIDLPESGPVSDWTAHSKLEVHFTFDRTPYGDAKDPRVKIHIHGYYKATGSRGIDFSDAVMVDSRGTLDPPHGLHVVAPEPSHVGELEDAI